MAPRHSRTVAKTGTEMPDGPQETAISYDVKVDAKEMKISSEGPHRTPCLKMSLEFTFPIPDLLDTLSSYARISPSAGSSRDAMAASRSPSSDPTQTTGVQPVDPGDVSRTKHHDGGADDARSTNVSDADDARRTMMEARRLLGPVAEDGDDEKEEDEAAE